MAFGSVGSLTGPRSISLPVVEEEGDGQGQNSESEQREDNGRDNFGT